MNAQEVLQILDKLKAIGAHHFKSEDFEVSLTEPMTVQLGKEFLPGDSTAISKMMRDFNAGAPPAPPPVSKENTQKVQELIEMLKLKDEELVNKIFPEGA